MCLWLAFPIRARIDLWDIKLRHFPFNWVRDWLLHGFEYGFSISHTKTPMSQLNKNHFIPPQACPKVSKWIHTESSAGRMIGPIPVGQLPQGTVISPIGTVPKNVTNYRVIHNLSFPIKNSVNICIPADAVSCDYATMLFA